MSAPRRHRHPAEVTNDRLLAACEKWFNRFYRKEMAAIGKARDALQRIADEDRGLLEEDEDTQDGAR